MDNELETQELDRGYREYAEVEQKLEQKLEQAKQEALLKAAAQAESMLHSFNYFLSKLL